MRRRAQDTHHPLRPHLVLLPRPPREPRHRTRPNEHHREGDAAHKPSSPLDARQRVLRRLRARPLTLRILRIRSLGVEIKAGHN